MQNICSAIATLYHAFQKYAHFYVALILHLILSPEVALAQLREAIKAKVSSCESRILSEVWVTLRVDDRDGTENSVPARGWVPSGNSGARCSCPGRRCLNPPLP